MIKQIILKNFQRHKEFAVDFGKTFNCITGDNNKGKSSIIRAIKWVFDNEPAGNWMNRRDKKGKVHTTVVKMILDDGRIIKRVKGVNKNYYALDDIEFHEIGRSGIPQEIQDALGLNRLLAELGHNVYIDSQDDQPFLVSEKNNGVKAGALNILTGTDLLERTIREVNRIKLNLGRDREHYKTTIDETTAKLKWYDRLDNLPLADIANLQRMIDNVQTKIDSMDALLEEYNSKCILIDEYEKTSKVYKDIYEFDHILSEYISVDDMLSRLNTLSCDYNNIAKLKKIPEIDFDYGNKLLRILDKVGVEISHLQSMENAYTRLTLQEETLRDEGIASMDNLKRLAGKRCPTCNGVIKAENLVV
jgi:exonuclease SbcC